MQQKLQPAEVALVAARDDLIERLRRANDTDEQALLKERLQKANICVSRVVGMEYPQGGVQREPLQQAGKLLESLATCHPGNESSSSDAEAYRTRPLPMAHR